MTDNFILPRLRTDLIFQVVEQDGSEFIIIVDPLQLTDMPVSVPMALLPLLQMMNKERNREELEGKLTELFGEQSTQFYEPVLNLLQYMDRSGLLESEQYQILKQEMEEYILSDSRPAICAGHSYSSDAESLAEELDDFLSAQCTDHTLADVNAAVLPHIDFRIGEQSSKAYSAAYKAIRASDADLFIILGTAHFGNSGLFMLTEKDYETPLGTVETDKQLTAALKAKLGNKIIFDELTHKKEHSIELQAVLLKHIFKHREFTVLPILTGSYHEFIKTNTSPESNPVFKDFMAALQETVAASGKKVFWIASADLAHIGRKFDDDFDAEEKLSLLADEDKQLLDSLVKADSEEFVSSVSQIDDRNKICGLSPIYSLLKLSGCKSGELLEYHQWNETETKSAVSFASLVFKK